MKKKILSFIVALSMLSALVLVPLPSSAVSPEDFTYTVNDDGTATITKYNGSDAEVTVPAEIDGYTITIIGGGAFDDNQTIRKIVLPNTIKRIQDTAFENSSLSSIKLSNNLSYIGGAAFMNTKLTYVNFPSSLTSLTGAMFIGCKDLAYIQIPHTVKNFPDTAFFGCDKDFLVVVGCANSLAQKKAEEEGFTFATIPCKDHTYSNGACTCCEILLGDLNKDGVVNMDDYRIIVGYVDNPTTCPDLSIADVNQDGVLDINDRLFLLEIISGASTWPV